MFYYPQRCLATFGELYPSKTLSPLTALTKQLLFQPTIALA
ncbi:hypothetical protein [Acinetobacter bereziniae]|nr:hypothetical protein [Acinetobacter bereziniae]